MFRKIWIYLKTKLNMETSKRMDPEVEIQMALEQDSKNHVKVQMAAREAITRANKLKMQITSKTKTVADLKAQAQQAVLEVEAATKAGDEKKVADYTRAAEMLAMEWEAQETLLNNDKDQYEDAVKLAETAKASVFESEMRLKESKARAEKLRGLHQQAKMKDAINASTRALQEATTLESLPTLDSLEEKLQENLARADATQELHQDTAAGVLSNIKASSMRQNASSKLDALREEMGITQAPATVTETAGELKQAQE